jgi:hypothetical protein
MRIALTPDLVRKAKPGPTRVFLWDSVVAGLGVVVHPTGKKTWVYQGSASGDRRRSIEASGLAQARKAVLALKLGLSEPVAPPTLTPAASGILTVNKLLDAWLAAMSERPCPPCSLPRIRASWTTMFVLGLVALQWLS